MNRWLADRLATLVVGSIIVLGGLWAWERYQEQQAFEGQWEGMMGPMMNRMEAVQGTDPFVIVIGTLVVAGTLGGIYLLLREELTDGGSTERYIDKPPKPGKSAIAEAGQDPAESSEGGNSPVKSVERAGTLSEFLDYLPEDERRILKPITSSPGLTQKELRDHSEFSKSKVSQTVSDLKQRGLIYREPQGRTYRLYPSDEWKSKAE